MAEFWGLEAICKRLGVRNHKTVMVYYTNYGLPMLKRRRGSHPRLWWWTVDEMLLAWQLKMCQMGREEYFRVKTPVSDARVRRQTGEVDDYPSKPEAPPPSYTRAVQPIAKPVCTCGKAGAPCRAHD